MTALTKPVRRTVDGLERRKVVVTLHPNGTVGLRAARTRHEYTLPLARVYRWAVEAELQATREAKRKARGSRRLVSRGLLTVGGGR